MRKNHAIILLVTAFTVGYAITATGAAPTAKEGYSLCNSEYKNCSGISGIPNNPHYIMSGCDYAKETGKINAKKWKQCRDWCEARYQKCNADVKEIFEE